MSRCALEITGPWGLRGAEMVSRPSFDANFEMMVINTAELVNYCQAATINDVTQLNTQRWQVQNDLLQRRQFKKPAASVRLSGGCVGMWLEKENEGGLTSGGSRIFLRKGPSQGSSVCLTSTHTSWTTGSPSLLPWVKPPFSTPPSDFVLYFLLHVSLHRNWPV